MVKVGKAWGGGIELGDGKFQVPHPLYETLNEIAILLLHFNALGQIQLLHLKQKDERKCAKCGKNVA